MTGMMEGMTVTFLPESPAVQLTRECCPGYSENVTCKGNMVCSIDTSILFTHVFANDDGRRVVNNITTQLVDSVNLLNYKLRTYANDFFRA